MAVFHRKYATLTVTGTTAIRIPIIKRGVVDFAVSADWTPAAGDVKVAIDGAAPASVTNLPTAVASGNTAYWEFIPTAAELTCKQAIYTVSDAATKAIEDTAFLVETFGHASAMYQADLSLANLPANVTQLLGTAWLPPGVAGTPDVNVKLWNALATVALPLVPTTAGRTLDVSTGGEAGLDWANVGSPTTVLALSGTTVATVTNQLTAAAIATGVWQDATAGDFTAGSSIGKSLYTSGVVPGGTNGLFIAGTNAATTITTALTTAFTGSLTGSVASVTGNVAGNVVGSVASVATGGITSASFATGAITAAAIAADAIGASELAADAITEIQAGLSTLTSANVADAVWNAATASYGTSGSYGLLVETNLDLAVSSRMATYTQPSGFLAATFPGGTVANTTNIAAGTITAVGTLTTYTGNTVQTGDAYARLGAPAGASHAADVAAVKTDTGNLVTRITSALFSGITNLASWLGAIAGKTADSATQAEIRATTAGASYTITTDSLEAIRDRGDAAWTTGGGGSAPTATEIRQEMDANSTRLAAIAASTAPLTYTVPLSVDATASATFSDDDLAALSATLALSVTQALSGAAVTVVSPLTAGGGALELVRDDAYRQADRTMPSWTAGGDWPADLTGWTPSVELPGRGLSLPAEVEVATGATRSIRLSDLSGADTDALPPAGSVSEFRLVITKAGGDRITLLRRGTLAVV